MKRKWTTDEANEWYLKTGAITYANKEDANIIVRNPRIQCRHNSKHDGKDSTLQKVCPCIDPIYRPA